MVTFIENIRLILFNGSYKTLVSLNGKKVQRKMMVPL